MRLRFFTLSIVLLAGTITSALALAASGEEVYQQQCAGCHGATGNGDGPEAGQNNIAAPRPFTQSAKERMTIEKAMLSGVTNVPGHGSAALFTAQELRDLIDYTHKLANP